MWAVYRQDAPELVRVAGREPEYRARLTAVGEVTASRSGALAAARVRFRLRWPVVERVRALAEVGLAA